MPDHRPQRLQGFRKGGETGCDDVGIVDRDRLSGGKTEREEGHGDAVIHMGFDGGASARPATADDQRIAFDANQQSIGSTVEVLTDRMDTSGQCVGRHCGQAPEIDSVCSLTDQRTPGSFVRCDVVDFDRYDLIVSPEQ